MTLDISVMSQCQGSSRAIDVNFGSQETSPSVPVFYRLSYFI